MASYMTASEYPFMQMWRGEYRPAYWHTTIWYFPNIVDITDSGFKNKAGWLCIIERDRRHCGCDVELWGHRSTRKKKGRSKYGRIDVPISKGAWRHICPQGVIRWLTAIEKKAAEPRTSNINNITGAITPSFTPCKRYRRANFVLLANLTRTETKISIFINKTTKAVLLSSLLLPKMEISI